MRGSRENRVRCAVVAAVVGALLVLALADTAQAQRVPGSAELKRVTGRVEVLRKGQTLWVPAVVGAKLVEGDDIRAFAGASAEMELPDTSTLLLTENSRVVVSKLEFDPQNQSRFVLFHLAVGKVRAVIAQAAITLVRARQSNFAITTPTAVAAARGTTVWVAFIADLGKTLAGVEPEPGRRITVGPEISCQSFFKFRRREKPVIVRGGQATEDCGPTFPALSLPQLFQPTNPIAPGQAIFAPQPPQPSLPEVMGILFAPPEVPPVSFTGGPTGDALAPVQSTSVGQDLNQPQPTQEPAHSGSTP